MPSYLAVYRSTDRNKCLIGGLHSSFSSRFGSRKDAETRLKAVIELNGPHCVGEVRESDLYPEIFAHCKGHPPQAIGGLCFGCKKKLTKRDAEKYNENV